MATGVSETLLIVGASVRAAAQSALRAGFNVRAVDLYGDVDLQAACESVQAKDVADLFAQARRKPPGPWMYTGGLENCPREVGRLARERELLGVAELAPLRALEALNGLLAAADLPAIVHRPASEMPTEGKWVLKPRHSSGGHRIEVYDLAVGRSLAGAAGFKEEDATHYWSPWIEGTPVGATFIVHDGGAALLGVCEQLSGSPWTGASGVTYAGSIGPLQLADEVVEQFARLGEQLAALPFVRGLIGVDAIVTRDNEVRVLEINPRYTASVEILERALGMHAIALHVSACRGEVVPSLILANDTCAAYGKAILYARAPVTISANFLNHCQAANADQPWPGYADLSPVGTRVEAGQPIVTLFAGGGCTETVRFALRQQAATTFAILARS